MKTHFKSKSKTSIFSYDLLSLMKAKLAAANKAKYTRDDGSASKPLATLHLTNALSQKFKNIGSNERALLFQGWVKYFKYDNHLQGPKPDSFFINNFYKEQFKRFIGEDFTKKDENGNFLFIPKEKYFFLTVFYDEMNFWTSRNVN
jgi:hypothetical protein